MLFKARPNDPFEIHLTYTLDKIDGKRKEEATKKFNSGRRTRAWTDEEDSLSHFFEEKRNEKHPFKLFVREDNMDAITLDLIDFPPGRIKITPRRRIF